MNVTSVHGRRNTQIQNMPDNHLLYWNNEKGLQLTQALGLQLPAKVAMNGANLESNIKTESDLRQYQSANNSANNRQSPESVANLADDIRAHLGKVMLEFADGVKVVQVLETMPKDAVCLITGGVEGWLNPRNHPVFFFPSQQSSRTFFLLRGESGYEI